MAGDLFEFFFKLALPVGVLSFFLMRWSLKSGRLKAEGDRKTVQAEIKALAKNRKTKGSPKSRNPVHNKWLRFGGGFYGAVALYTFILIEIQEVFDFAGGYEDFDTVMASFGNSSFADLLVQFLINSIQNFVWAIAWPGYWVDGQDGRAIGLGFLILYGSYWLGLNIARKQTSLLPPDGGI